MNCPKCAIANSENAKFCKSCGVNFRGDTDLKPESHSKVLRCMKCGTENGEHAKFCKACGILMPQAFSASLPPPVPVLPASMLPPVHVLVPVAPPAAEPEKPPSSVACYKCKSDNNINAKFCKGCGVATPSIAPIPPVVHAPKTSAKSEFKNPLVIWTSIAVGVLAISGGGAYWMLGGSSETKAPSTSSSTPLPVAAPMAPAKVLPATTEAASIPVALPIAPAPAPAPVPVKPMQDEARQGPTQAQRQAQENARKKQAERDKVKLNNTNRTLDDLLK